MSSNMRYRLGTVNLPKTDFERMTVNITYLQLVGDGKDTPFTRFWAIYADDGTLLLEVLPDFAAMKTLKREVA